MTGKTLAPPERHECQPGVEADNDQLRGPTVWSHPKGTRWRCDGCGRVWVSRGDRYRNQCGPVYFTPEGVIERLVWRWRTR